MPDVEIIYPSTNGPGPIDSILSKRPEGIVYHLCFSTTNLDDSLEALTASGLKFAEVSPLKPAILFPGNAVGFYMIQGVGLVEMVVPALSRGAEPSGDLDG